MNTELNHLQFLDLDLDMNRCLIFNCDPWKINRGIRFGLSTSGRRVPLILPVFFPLAPESPVWRHFLAKKTQKQALILGYPFKANLVGVCNAYSPMQSIAVLSRLVLKGTEVKPAPSITFFRFQYRSRRSLILDYDRLST